MSRFGSYGLPLFPVVVWGGMFIVMAGALHHVDAVHLTAVRYVVAAAVLAAVLAATAGRRAFRTEGRLAEVVVLGVVGIAGFNLLVNIALGYTAPQNGALMVALTPLLTVLVRWVRDRVRPSLATVALMVVALAGVGLVITHGHPTDLGEIGSGDLMAFLGVVGWAVYTHGAGRFADWGSLRFSTLTQIVGAAVTVLVALVADLTGVTHLPTLAAFGADAWQIGYIALLSSVLAVLAWNVAIRKLGAPNAALFMKLVPVVTFAIQIARGYRPVPAEIVGAALTVAALVATNVLARRATARATAGVRGVPVPARQPVPTRQSVSTP
ncbi:DMT family transporter [Actinocatenispora rupis]|uniref:Transporter n=1 Tax=Actinocatenispora rupis TaxID=519421 RepID=A0A8J3JBI1_9ACTN|nr:DMT family transporter [Actinocatenispora rupis]GID13734.1 transporter [Actinocatenispora rupis]